MRLFSFRLVKATLDCVNSSTSATVDDDVGSSSVLADISLDFVVFSGGGFEGGCGGGNGAIDLVVVRVFTAGCMTN